MMRQADELKAILAENAKVEKLAGNMQFTEGPVYDARIQSVIYSDIPANMLYRYSLNDKKNTVYRTPSGAANGNTLDLSGRLLSCEHGNRRVSRTDADGMVVTLAYQYEGKRLNSPNDIVVKKDGTLYFTDPPYGLPNEKEGKELDVNGVYRILSNGSLVLLVKECVRPNGLAFSPDEKVLYIADSNQQHMRAFDVAPDGTLVRGRVFADMRNPGKQGAPDGLKVDVRGNIYCTGAGGVWVFAPDGKKLGIIETPEVPTNVGFGEPDAKTLFITAQSSLYSIRLKIAGILPVKPNGR